MSRPGDARARLASLGALADERIDLADAALALAAAARPRVPREPYLRHLARLADEVATYVDATRSRLDAALAAEALGHVLARRYGYGGEESVDDVAESANLMRVIDRRRGLPVALGILYIAVGRVRGWTMSGLDFPARFLVRLEHEGNRVVLDPADGGRALRSEDMRALVKAVVGNHAELERRHFRAIGNREVLLKLETAVKLDRLRRDRLDAALETIETMLLFAPGAAELWREAGLLHARLDNVRAAVAALEEFMRRTQGDAQRYRTSLLLQELRARLG